MHSSRRSRSAWARSSFAWRRRSRAPISRASRRATRSGPEWVRPTSKDEYYRNGDKVTFEGVHYVCDKNNVVASPAEDPKSWIGQD